MSITLTNKAHCLVSVLLSKKPADQSAVLANESFQESSDAKFTSGSILKHVVIMSLASTVGLMALFLVDLLDMFFSKPAW